MSNILEVGSIVNGKVINVKPYGAFISIGNNQKGLVHISHISSDFVRDINEFLHQGDSVKVKILSVDENGKIALSLKDVSDEFKIENQVSEQKKEQESEVVEVHHKSYATTNEKVVDEKRTKTLEELLKEYNKQANDRQVDINKRLKR